MFFVLFCFGLFFARGQNVPYNAFKIKVIVPSMIPISMDLHVKCDFYKKKKENHFFLTKFPHGI